MPTLDFLYKPIAKATANYLKSEARKANTQIGVDTGGPVIKRSAYDSNVMEPSLRRKPQSSVSFQTLRRFSVTHEVARICINARKRQISSLEWEIVAVDPEDHTNYSKDIDLIKQYFKNIGGYRMRFREFQDILIEDLMTLDALALYKQRNRSGAIEYYMPVDAATLKLRVDDAGNTPQPPEPAYVQYIRGQKTGEYTADEIIYEMMNPRSDTPYGLAPLESLIMVVTSSLKSSLYNMDFLTAGNLPEGLLTMPQDWSTKQISEFMAYFDALVSGNSRESTKMKPVPNGSTFTPTQKRSDMAFQEFNNWLMQLTCAMFDIQPQEIGFTMDVNKSNGSEQNDIATRRGILPLANLMTEMFNDIIQADLGFSHLCFSYLGLEDRDMLADAQAKQTRLNAGIVTIDEVRKQEGLDPLGIDRPYIPSLTQFVTPELVDGTAKPPTEPTDEPVKPTDDPAPDKPVIEDAKEKSADAKHIETVAELKRFEKYVVGRLKNGKSLRKFESAVLPAEVLDDMNERIAKASDLDEAKAMLNEFHNDYQVSFLADVANLKTDIQKILE